MKLSQSELKRVINYLKSFLAMHHMPILKMYAVKPTTNIKMVLSKDLSILTGRPTVLSSSLKRILFAKLYPEPHFKVK
jgi:hypothetical protein